MLVYRLRMLRPVGTSVHDTFLRALRSAPCTPRDPLGWKDEVTRVGRPGEACAYRGASACQTRYNGISQLPLGKKVGTHRTRRKLDGAGLWYVTDPVVALLGEGSTGYPT